MIEYSGYRLPRHAGRIEEVEADDLDARTFWAKFVSQRRPVSFCVGSKEQSTTDDWHFLKVLINGHPTDASFKATAKWDNKYLKTVAVSGPRSSWLK
jgi:hypothetical protein